MSCLYVYWAVLNMESHEESDLEPSGKKRDYQRTNFTDDIAAYLSLRQFPDHIGTDKSKKANFRPAGTLEHANELHSSRVYTYEARAECFANVLRFTSISRLKHW